MSSSRGMPTAKAAYHDVDNLTALNQTEQTSNVFTKTDERLLAEQQLCEAAHHLKNIASELNECVSILEGSDSLQRR